VLGFLRNDFETICKSCGVLVSGAIQLAAANISRSLLMGVNLLALFEAIVAAHVLRRTL
jgi:hypothetical protein